MDFSFNEEQTLLRNTIQSFIQDNYDFDKRTEIVKSEEGMKKSIEHLKTELIKKRLFSKWDAVSRINSIPLPLYKWPAYPIINFWVGSW